MPLMTILILIGVVSLVLGPIMLMQPTQAERRLARLREVAAQAGLRVHLQPLPSTVHSDDRVGMAAMYCLPWQEQKHARATWLLTKRGYSHELHFDGLWEWHGKDREASEHSLRDAMAKIPPKVLAVARGPQGLCCYWTELGNEGDVKVIAAWLKDELFAITA